MNKRQLVVLLAAGIYLAFLSFMERSIEPVLGYRERYPEYFNTPLSIWEKIFPVVYQPMERLFYPLIGLSLILIIVLRDKKSVKK